MKCNYHQAYPEWATTGGKPEGTQCVLEARLRLVRYTHGNLLWPKELLPTVETSAHFAAHEIPTLITVCVPHARAIGFKTGGTVDRFDRYIDPSAQVASSPDLLAELVQDHDEVLVE